MGPGSHTQRHVNILLSSAGRGALSHKGKEQNSSIPPSPHSHKHRQCQLGPCLRLLAAWLEVQQVL